MLECRQTPTHAPALKQFQARMNDAGELEVDLQKGQSMNQLFAELGEHDLEVLSVRAKANRLEELFLSFVKKPNKGLA